MKTLADILGAPAHQAGLIADIVELIEAQVADRKGLRGISLRTALAMLRAARPQLLPQAAKQLLPAFAGALDPLYQRFLATAGQDFGAFLLLHAAEAQAVLLTTADRRVETLRNAALRAGYARLRSTAEDEVRAAIPAVAALLGRHLAGRGS